MQIIRSVLGLSPPCRRDALAGAREACRVAGETIERLDREALTPIHVPTDHDDDCSPDTPQPRQKDLP